MKIETCRTLLKQVNAKPLYEIDKEYVSNALKVCEDQGQTKNVKIDNMLTDIVHNQPLTNTNRDYQVPPIFKKTFSYDSPYRLQTPACGRQKLINLSFSQPSTPKTPFCQSDGHGRSYQTPCLFINKLQRTPIENQLLSTPMLINSLYDIRAEGFHHQSLRMYPDILQMIDDDNGGGTSDTLERQLKLFSDVELNSENVADYLLDLSQEFRSQPHTCQEVEIEIQQPLRKGRHTKLTSEEERQSLQKLQKQKQKLRRKERLKKAPTCGTRKSKRIRKPVKYTYEQYYKTGLNMLMEN